MQIDSVRKLHDLGWWIVPNWGLMPDYPEPCRQICACPDGSDCNQPGKHPVRRWKDQPRNSIWDLEYADQKHRCECYGALPNWSVRLGASKLCVVDIDNHAGGPDGAASWANLIEEHGPMPKTVADNHGHLYFRLPDDSTAWNKTAYQLAPGVELLGGSSKHDHLIIVPPSQHHSGNGYDFLPGCDPFTCEIAELPAWIEQARATEDKRAFVPEPVRQPKYMEYAKFVRSHGIVNQNTIRRAEAWLAKRPPATTGSGHGYKLKTAFIIAVGFDLPESEAAALLIEWDRLNPPSKTPDDIAEMARTARQNGGSFGFMLRRQPGRVIRLVRPKDKSDIKCSCKQVCCPQCDDHYEDLTADDVERWEAIKDIESSLDDWESSALDTEPEQPEQIVTPMEPDEAAAAIAEMRKNKYPCLRSRTVLIERFDFRQNGIVLDMIDPRCNAWHCPACSTLHKEEWCVNYRLRLTGDAKPDKPAWSMVIPKSRQATVTKRIQRVEGGEYFFCDAPPEVHGDGMRLIVANVEFSGADKTTAKDAADRICACIRAYSGESRPTGSSRGWQLPKRPKGVQQLKRIGVVRDGGISTEDAIAIGEKHGVVVGRIEVPQMHKFRVRLWRVADVRHLDREQRYDFYSDLLVAGNKRKTYSAATGATDVNDDPDWAKEWHEEYKRERCPINAKGRFDSGRVGHDHSFSN